MIIDTAKDTLPVRINAPSLCPASPATPRRGGAVFLEADIYTNVYRGVNIIFRTFLDTAISGAAGVRIVCAQAARGAEGGRGWISDGRGGVGG